MYPSFNPNFPCFYLSFFPEILAGDPTDFDRSCFSQWWWGSYDDSIWTGSGIKVKRLAGFDPSDWTMRMARPRIFWFCGEQPDCTEVWRPAGAGIAAQLVSLSDIVVFCWTTSIDSPAAKWSLSLAWSCWSLLLRALALLVDLVTLVRIHGGAGTTTAIDGSRFGISTPGSSGLGRHLRPDCRVGFKVVLSNSLAMDI